MMDHLSTKEDAELKKLKKRFVDVQSTIEVKIPRQIAAHKNRAKDIERKIKAVQKKQKNRKIKIDRKKLEKLKADIKKIRIPARIDIVVKEAEMIAEHFEGILPPSSLLQNYGFSGVNVCVRENPKKFKHIKQDKRQKTIKQHVKYAEQLAKNNERLLPHALYLRENGDISLNICMKKYPYEFSHILQRKVQKNPDEWMKIATKILSDNNDVWPTKKTLNEDGLGGLITCMRIHPKKFAHLQINKKRTVQYKSAKDHLSDIKQLIKVNNGVVPTATFLNQKMGAAAASIRRHPKIFKHIIKMQKKQHGKSI